MSTKTRRAKEERERVEAEARERGDIRHQILVTDYGSLTLSQLRRIRAILEETKE
jgi:hypothetical protein